MGFVQFKIALYQQLKKCGLLGALPPHEIDHFVNLHQEHRLSKLHLPQFSTWMSP